MKVYLVRHGKTQANIDKLYCGSTDSPLSDIGRRELLAIKESSDSFVYDVCLCSPLIRCIETYDILFGDTDKRILVDGLKEIDFGEFENKSHDMLLDNPHYQNWLDHWPHSHIPKGEQFTEFETRVMKTFSEILETYKGKTLLLVCHGGVIMMILSKYFKEKAFHQWKTPNGSGYLMELDNNSWTYKEL